MVVVVYGTDGADRLEETARRIREQTEKKDRVIVQGDVSSFSGMANGLFCDELIYDDILFVQAPCTAEKNSVRALRRALEGDSRAGIAVPVSPEDGEGRLPGAAGLRAGTFLLGRHAMEKAEFFDEECATPRGAVLDYIRRCALEGYTAAVCPDAVFSCPDGGAEAPERERRDAAYLERKWGIRPPCFAGLPSGFPAVAGAGTPVRVFGTGSGFGAALLAVRDRYPDAELHGAGDGGAEVTLASRYFDAKAGSLGERVREFAPNSFDCVIFGDALDSRREPEQDLRLCRELLKEGGCILAGFHNEKKTARLLSRCGYRTRRTETVPSGTRQADGVCRVVEAEALGNRVYAVPPLEKYQECVNELAKTPYRGGVHLWKYLIDNLSAGFARTPSENLVFRAGIESDEFREATDGELARNERLLESLGERDFLFAVTPIRRLYKGRYDQTAFDDYMESIAPDRYTVIEPERAMPEGEYRTRNRHVFSPAAVTTKYGLAGSDREDIAGYLETHMFRQAEDCFRVRLHPDLKANAVIRASMIVREREAYLSFFSEVLDRVRPKAVVFVHSPIPWICYMDEAARKKGIPTVEIAHGFNVRRLVFPPEFDHADYFLTQSPLTADAMREAGYGNVYAVGKPFVYRDCGDGAGGRSRNSGKTGQAEEAVQVGFVSSSEPGFLETALRVASRLPRETYRVHYKPHPSEALPETRRAEAERAGLELSGGGVDMRDFLKGMDVIVGISSTAVVDALPCTRIKVIVMRQEENVYLEGNAAVMRRLARNGDLVIADYEEELYREILSFRRGREYRQTPDSYWPAESDRLFRDFLDRLARGNAGDPAQTGEKGQHEAEGQGETDA